jgi:hypothetical protein
MVALSAGDVTSSLNAPSRQKLTFNVSGLFSQNSFVKAPLLIALAVLCINCNFTFRCGCLKRHQMVAN